MASGWLLQGIALYTANTGDMRYAQPRSLRFEVTKKSVYYHDLHTLSKAVVDQRDRNPYCLFPCEPNWIYSPCNLQGWIVQVVYDRTFGTDHTERLRHRFERSMLEEFGEPDASILPIRSELTGFSIPGLCSVLGNLSNAMYCRGGGMNHISRRMWAIFRRESVRVKEENGDLEILGLVGADRIDPGTYKPHPYAMLPMVAHAAAEFGDDEVRVKALAGLERGIESTIDPKTEAVRFRADQAGF